MTGEGSMSRNESSEGGGTDADIERRLSEMNMQLIRMMTEFVRQETKITERYRDCIDRLQEQNEKLSGMIEKMIPDEQPNRKRSLGKTVIG